ncbi:serine/threonine-protein phosphatase 2A regulatory subunit B'' subunit beta-like isoform X1 [Acipenser oxyrinchus oxyrinchus]|uniref:Serine/threonine-protein phosphatase 2A regulatory subunit B'' subunit beta-like isoform X1 n=1 Tax=Acipenser oxyrinchus oxyrinchus TaxID=40147 RepID=A0AAD8DJQ2_ACIOX|nr:serine/threonine-protein phosphatase 2A regulatory subunit B'' subunit beta-like isoform X1 [Acipenser oxyrinchus oxyrinchus]
MKLKMPAAPVLQPVLKMKVDELFLNWLSETTTQLMLKDYLKRIKNGERFECGEGDLKDNRLLVCNENKNNFRSKQKVTDKAVSSLSAPSSPPSPITTALPSGNTGSPRVGHNRAVRRSIGSKLAQVKKEEPLTPALSESIPKFYFPRGRPKPNINIDALISRIEKTFSQFPNERATLEDMGKVAKACECPLYWKAPLFYAAGGDRTGFVSVHKFIAMWRKKIQTCHDDAAKFVHLLAKPSCNYLEQEDLIPFLQDVVNTHAGLTFLREASDFHSRYITTVIQRIFYNVNRSWTGKMTCSDLRKSSFLQNVALLEEEEDVNQLTEYFSYEHFYVIYCKFWELDADHDLYIDQKDLARHNDHALSHKMIERIFSGAVTRGRKAQKERKMSYADFVWFLISEEDKKTNTSIEYWFRCLDLDGDGVLSMYELEYFYEEQCQKLENMAIEPLPFEDCLCQMLDLVKPECEGKITLHDLKKCKLSHIFFDTLFNIEKYLDHEQKDPFSRDGENEGQEISDWERYAAEEYEILVAEEAANEQFDGYENDLDPIDRQISNELNLRGDKRSFFEIPNPHPNINLDEYEYEDDFE